MAASISGWSGHGSRPLGDVSILGFQFSDGRVERHIVDAGSPDEADRARQRAAALIEAADELDRLQ
jgi:hypothetical protein